MKTSKQVVQSALCFVKVFSVIAAVAFTQSARGALIAYDGFNYPAGSSLTGQNGGQGFSNAWYQGGFNVSQSAGTVESGSLAYPSLATTGNQVAIPASSLLNGIQRDLVSSISTGTVYFSCLLCPEQSLNGWSGFYLDGSSAELYMGTQITHYYVMNQRGGYNEVASPAVAVVGQPEFLVLKAQLQSTGNDIFTMYTDPTPGAPEPSTGTVKSDLNIGTLSGLTLYSDGAFDFDELRVGTTYADVTSVPEPSTIALLLAGAVSLFAFAWRGRA